MVDYLDEDFAREGLSEGDGGSSLTVDDRSVIATAPARLSTTVPGLGSDVANSIKGLFAELEASQAARAEIEKEIERENWLVSEAEKVKNDAFNDVANLQDRVTAASTRAREV